jgi:hypothetical protein
MHANGSSIFKGYFTKKKRSQQIKVNQWFISDEEDSLSKINAKKNPLIDVEVKALQRIKKIFFNYNFGSFLPKKIKTLG